MLAGLDRGERAAACQRHGRRSDHSRAELEELILSIGTIHHVFDSADRLIAAINTRSFAAWARYLGERLAQAGDGDRIATVHGHCAFAISGAWALMGEAAPEATALARVREALAAASQS